MPLTVSPNIPTESSTAAPSGRFSDWFKNIGDWIKGMSPAGSAQYDTGWVSTGLTINSGTGFTAESYRFRRVGMLTYIRLTSTYTGTGITTAANGDVVTTYTIFTLPAGWQPSEVAPISISRNATQEWFGLAQTAGEVQLTHGLPNQTLATGTLVHVRGFFFAP